MDGKKTGELKIQFGKYVEKKDGDRINKVAKFEKPFKISDVTDNAPYSFTVQKIKGNDIVNGGVSMNRSSESWEFSDGEKVFKIFIE